MEEKINQILVYTLLAAKNVLTLDDVSLLTGLSKSHLYKLTCNRQIPHYKPNGKQLYFDRAEIEAWMKQGKVNTIDESEQMAAVYLARLQGSKEVGYGKKEKGQSPQPPNSMMMRQR